MPEYFDYIIVAFFAAFLGLKYVRTKATGHLWFLLPLLLIMGLNQGWGTIFGNEPGNNLGRAWFVLYRMATAGSCFLAAYMYYRDYHKREQEAITVNAEKRKKQQEKMQQAKQSKSKKKK